MSRRRLLLVGWDAADWKIMRPLVEAGKLPVVAALVKAGVSGDCTTLEPQLSPMLWTSIATGKMAYHHGVCGFTEVDAASGRVVPVSASTRRCRTVWEILGGRQLSSHVVGWFATQGEQLRSGCVVSNLFPHLPDAQPGQEPAAWPPPPPGTFWPPELGAALNELRISPSEVEEILPLLVPDCANIDQSKDPRLRRLAEKIAEAYSVHAAAVWLMENRPDWDFFAVYYRAIDEICHVFMRYHQPGLRGVSEEDVTLYRHVVEGAYRLHDLMLGRLIQLAGPDCGVMLVSDHGFHSDHLRPQHTPNVPAGITVWHRRQGVFAAGGGAFAKGADILGAGLLDIAPTILRYFHVPVGRDMEGRVLEEAFQEPRVLETIESWETGVSLAPRAEIPEQAALLEHFIAMGYIDRPADDPDEAAAGTRRENKWNLSRALYHVGRCEEALPLIEDCFFEFPERSDFAQLLAQTQVKLGLLAEAEETVGLCLEMVKDGQLARLIQARIALLRGDPAGAQAILDKVRGRAPENPELLFLLARAYFFNRRWREAEEISRGALAIDPGHTFSKIILARCALRQCHAREAVHWALAAVSENFSDSTPFYLLGAGYAQLEDWPKAEAALLQHLQRRPANAAGLKLLIRCYRRSGDFAKAAAGEVTLAARLRRPAAPPSAEHLTLLRKGLVARQLARQAARAGRRRMERAAADGGEFLIVSGLPRSGTSLMMQIVAAAGVPVMTDGKRERDAHNSEGYFEWEPIKSLRQHPHVIAQAAGKAVKVVAPLLPCLPDVHRYRIIYMLRPLAQVMASQCLMLGESAPAPDEQVELARRQERHQAELLKQLRTNPRCDLLDVSYPDLVANPPQMIEAVADFLGVENVRVRAAMANTVRSELHRNRP